MGEDKKLETCRSIIVKQFGGYKSLAFEEFPLPDLEGNVEVKVEYAGLNFADLYTRQGLMLDKKLPFVLGIECSGKITAIGAKTNLKVGERVICYDYRGGMYRERVRVSPDTCFPIPDEISPDIGASLFVNYLTAYFALNDLGHLKEDDTVLILSCAGGVGCAATQLAKLKEGVKVFGTGSSEKEKEVKKNGVDVFYPNESFEKDVGDQRFDVIIANQAGTVFTFAQNLLKPFGTIILIGANEMIKNEHKLSVLSMLKAWWHVQNIAPETLITNNRIVAGLHLGNVLEKQPEKVKKALDEIILYCEQNKIKPIIHSVWPWEQIVDATKLLAERKNVGKVLIQISE